jgi:Protein of unknown function (DUF2927)
MIYDQYLLNILYDPRIRPGMTRDQVDAVLPDILSSTRAWVHDRNAPNRKLARSIATSDEFERS